MGMQLTCPVDRLPLKDLRCPTGHEYPCYDGIPILLREDVPPTIWTLPHSLKQARGQAEFYQGDHHQFVSEQVAGTNGYLYLSLTKNLCGYPIPTLPLTGSGTFLDVGCNWGRWSVAAARQGFKVVGIDSTLDGLLAARRICRELGVQATFICGDARYLPFEDGSFEQAFSFSVLQHFSKVDAHLAYAEMKRVAKTSMIQMPGKYGVRALYHQLRYALREEREFDVRYWSPAELEKMGQVAVHAYFGTGIVSGDTHLLPWRSRVVVKVSDSLTQLSRNFKPLQKIADSYYVTIS